MITTVTIYEAIVKRTQVFHLPMKKIYFSRQNLKMFVRIVSKSSWSVWSLNSAVIGPTHQSRCLHRKHFYEESKAT